MKIAQCFIILLLGFAIGAGAIYKVVSQDKYEFGHNQGKIDGSLEVVNFLDKHFHQSSFSKSKPGRLVGILGVKDRSISVYSVGDNLIITTE